MWYSPQKFNDSITPEKRKSDSLLVHFLIRPISFLTSSLFGSMGFSANAISFLSIFLGIAVNVLIFLDNYVARIVGASLLFLWLIFDCTDGNIARTIRKEKYGEFMDATSGFFTVSFLFFCESKVVFDNGGLLFSKGDFWPLIIGGLASISTTLARLLFQKFKAGETAAESGMSDQKSSQSKSLFHTLRLIEDRFSKELGLCGLLPVALLLAMVFPTYSDIFLIVYASLSAVFLLASVSYFLVSVWKANRHDSAEKK